MNDFRPSAILTLLWLAVALPAMAAQRGFDLGHTSGILTKEINTLLADTGIPSISIALLKDGEIIWKRAFGYSNVKLKVPATSNTIYNTGSCFKPVTAMAVMQLVEKKKLHLDTPINDYLGENTIEDMSSAGNPVTVRHLLSHYSGLTMAQEFVPLWERVTPRSLHELATQTRAGESPGVNYRYSNTGYALAGLLIEKVSGQSYEDYIVENILKPAGVMLTGPVNPTPEMLEELALPYRIENNKAVPERLFRADVYPAGDIYLSVPAMSKILLAFINGGKSGAGILLSEASVAEMRTPQFGGTDGLDFGIREFGGDTLLMHGGGVPGYSTKFILAVDSGVGVYVACNAGNALTPLRIVAQLSIDLLRGIEIGTGLVQKIAAVGFGLATDQTAGAVRITEVLPGSPARRAGLTAGTIIRSINGISVSGKSIQECLSLMAGPVGTKVHIEFVNPEIDAPGTVELTKQTILIPGPG